MEYKTGDPDYVWKCHRCDELEQERDALVRYVRSSLNLRNSKMPAKAYRDLPEATRKEIES